MECNQVGLIARDPENLAITIGNVAMRRSVKSVTPYPMASIELIRERVKIWVFGQSLVKRGIEYCYLRQSTTKHLTRRDNAFDIGRIVERRKVNTILYAAQHFICNQNRVCEPLAAVYNSMTNSMNIRDALNALKP